MSNHISEMDVLGKLFELEIHINEIQEKLVFILDALEKHNIIKKKE